MATYADKDLVDRRLPAIVVFTGGLRPGLVLTHEGTGGDELRSLRVALNISRVTADAHAPSAVI